MDVNRLRARKDTVRPDRDDDNGPPGEPEPQILDERIWIDGCFDFFHHGHAGAIVQARQLGKELYVGVHSDEAILENKGPTVMTLEERLAAVDACRWATKSIGHAPYVTRLDWITHFGCRYVVHGDDITSDSGGEDCYRFVKAAGRFRVVKRTPAISTTDLVGRMLLCTRGHFIRSLRAVLAGTEGSGSGSERDAVAAAMLERITLYATDETGLAPGADVIVREQGEGGAAGGGDLQVLVEGRLPRDDQHVVYVDGGFDLFSSGHLEFLRLVVQDREQLAREKGWYEPEAAERRRAAEGEDYPPVFVVAGVHDDLTINKWKGVNYPIMNMYERGLCVLQCRYVNSVIFGAPFSPSRPFLESLPYGSVKAVYHGPTSFMKPSDGSNEPDPYADARALGIFREIRHHAYADVNAGTIVARIMRSRDMYEARQRAKGDKSGVEEAVKLRERLEEEQREKERERERTGEAP